MKTRPGGPARGFDTRTALQAAAQHHQAGRLQQAEALYRQILAIDANHADALHLLGVLAHQTGRSGAAEELIRRAIGRAARSPAFHCNLGVVLLARGALEEAAACFERALALKPDYDEAHNNRGLVQMRLGKLAEAERSFARALALRPEYANASYNRGLVLQMQGDVAAAIVAYERALALRPDHADAHNDLGTALQAQGRQDEAAAHYAAALRVDSAHAQAHNNLGTLLQDRGRVDEAAAHYRQALAAAPGLANAHFNLGKCLLEQCRREDARACFAEAQRLTPDDRNRIAMATALCPVMSSSADLAATRAQMTRDLATLLDADIVLADPLKQGLTPNALLAYHGLDDRPLQEALARLYLKACPALAWTAPGCCEQPRARGDRRIRVGFVSRYFYNHTVGEVTRGLLEHLDRVRFEITVLRIGPEDDALAHGIDAAADHVASVPGSLREARELIGARALDALVYPEVGMDPGTYFLAFSRLAPVQCVMWGHPDTTGIPNLDYYVSSADIEPANAQAHYSERLVRLAHVPAYYYRPALSDPLPDRAALELPERGNLYVCAQTLYKFHPDFDPTLAAILRLDPEGWLVLFEGRHPSWSGILRTRLRAALGDAVDRVLFLPRMTLPRYLALLTHACAALDTHPFGGGNTSYQALGLGVPIVTWPGAFARGRVTAALYERMGIIDLIARNADEYVALAHKLATQPDFRREIGLTIQRRCGVIYEDLETVREFERFLEAACDAAPRGETS